MLFYCWKCRKKIGSERAEKTKNGRIIVLSNCAVGGSKKSRFIKEQDASGILISQGLRTTSSKIPLASPI